MNIAYIRVSTIDQNIDRQREALNPYSIEKWFEEKVSGKDTNRPQLMAMLDFAREGDVIYVAEFSRLARNTKDLLNLIEHLNNKGVEVKSLKEQLDTSTSTGKLMITMLAAISEFERGLMLERQKEGIEIAKRKGKYKGRAKIKKPQNYDVVMADYYNRRITAKRAMELLNLKRTTFYKLIRENQEHK